MQSTLRQNAAIPLGIATSHFCRMSGHLVAKTMTEHQIQRNAISK